MPPREANLVTSK
jgi:hypothetical protein